MRKAELNYNQKLTYKSEWVRYFGEYNYTVDLIFQKITAGEITVVALPLAFLIRHTLELGYKMNLIELEKVSDVSATIRYSGRSAHKIDDLHREFIIQVEAIFKKYNIEEAVTKQFYKYNRMLEELKRTLHKLDTFSYAFRYPVENDGVTLNFNIPDNTDLSDSINFKEIKELYDESIILLKYTTDVIAENIPKENQ